MRRGLGEGREEGMARVNGEPEGGGSWDSYQSRGNSGNAGRAKQTRCMGTPRPSSPRPRQRDPTLILFRDAARPGGPLSSRACTCVPARACVCTCPAALAQTQTLRKGRRRRGPPCARQAALPGGRAYLGPRPSPASPRLQDAHRPRAR